MGAAGVFQVLAHHFLVSHAAEDNRDFRAVPEEIQGPFHRGTVRGELLLHLGAEVGQLAAQQGLHNHHAKALGRGSFQAPEGCLVFYVYVVHLDLAEIPLVKTVEDFQESVLAVVERESQEADFSFVPGLPHFVQQAEG